MTRSYDGFGTFGSQVDRDLFPGDFSEDIARHRGEHGSPCEYVPSGYLRPDYSALGPRRTAYYLWWREVADHGRVDRPDDGYAWLYCRETIESPDDPEEVLGRLVRFTRTCSESLRLAPVVAPIASEYALWKGMSPDGIPRQSCFGAVPWIVARDLTRYPIARTFPGRLLAFTSYPWRRDLKDVGPDTVEEMLYLSLRGIDERVRSTQGKGLLRALGCDMGFETVTPLARYLPPDRTRSMVVPVMDTHHGPFQKLMDSILRLAVNLVTAGGGPPKPRSLPREYEIMVAAAVDAVFYDQDWEPVLFRKGDGGFWEDDVPAVPDARPVPRLIPMRGVPNVSARPSLRGMMSHWGDESEADVPYVPSGGYEVSYEEMDPDQLAFYISWRTRARRGEFGDTDQGYLWLFCTEAVNVDDDPVAIQGMLESALEAYGSCYGVSCLRSTVCDHAVLHGLDIPPGSNWRDTRYAAYDKLAREPTGRMGVESAAMYSDYDAGKYVDDDRELYGEAFTEAVRAVDAGLVRFRGHRIIDMCGTPEVTVRMRLYAILWTPSAVVKEVTFRNVLGSHRVLSLMDGIYRLSIRLVNARLDRPGPRCPKGFPPFLYDAVHEAVGAVMDRRDRERMARDLRWRSSRIVLDRDAVESAHRDLEAVTGMMAVQEDDAVVEEIAPGTGAPGGWEGLASMLDPVESAYLRDSLTPRGAGPWSLEGTGRRPSEVEQAVNSKAMDAIGDVVIEDGRAVEEYAKELEDLV